MSDRHFAYTVILTDEKRDDDSEAIINAIAMIKGVASVQPLVSDVQLYYAEMRAKNAIKKKLYDILE